MSRGLEGCVELVYELAVQGLLFRHGATGANKVCLSTETANLLWWLSLDLIGHFISVVDRYATPFEAHEDILDVWMLFRIPRRIRGLG